MESRKDKIIKSTDLDALSCRFFADKYLQDPLIRPMLEGVKKYLPLSSSINLSIQRNLKTYFTHPKNPIINRGTYLRTKSIDLIVDAFVNQDPSGQPRQIVSIGAGSDTRFLNVLRQRQEASADQNNLRIFEYDFEESIKVKKLTLLNDPVFRGILGLDEDQDSQQQRSASITSHDEFNSISPILSTPHYKLHPIDLRSQQSITKAFSNLDPAIPTLVLSECVLCYMSIEESDHVIQYLTNLLTKGMFIIYEPIGGEGGNNFGQVMIQNLAARGIEIPSLSHFKTLSSQYERFHKILQDIGNTRIQINDMNYVMDNWIDSKELQRINRLEFLDELEELKLINKHYCLCIVQWGKLDLILDQNFEINK